MKNNLLIIAVLVLLGSNLFANELYYKLTISYVPEHAKDVIAQELSEIIGCTISINEINGMKIYSKDLQKIAQVQDIFSDNTLINNTVQDEGGGDYALTIQANEAADEGGGGYVL